MSKTHRPPFADAAWPWLGIKLTLNGDKATARSPWRLKPGKRAQVLARMRAMLRSKHPVLVLHEPDRVTRLGITA